MIKPFTENTEEVINRSKELIKEYIKTGSKLHADGLLELQDKLVGAYAFLGDVSAEYNKDYAMSYRNRIMVKSSNIVMAISDGDSATKAKEASEDSADVQQSRFDEITNSYLAESVLNLCKSIAKTLDCISRRITYLRDNLKQEYKPNHIK